jgi:hypothetical protein
MPVPPIPRTEGKPLYRRGGYFFGGRNAARDSTELLLAADDLGAATQVWIIKKSWIFEDPLAMVLSEYPNEMARLPSIR